MAKWLNYMPFFVWILVIWFNNLLASTVSFVLGVFLIPPALAVLANGVIVGLAQKISVTHGISSIRFYLSIVPHGIFELSAFFIAAGLGIRFGLVLYHSWWRLLTGKDNAGLFKNFAAEMKYYASLIVILLSIAAIVEVTVSPLLLPK
jgi:stage II sporulation protein M